MIHEALESGGSITQDKGHDQKLIVALIISKGILTNVFLFHTDLVVARTKVKFSKELCANQFIQEVINDRNGKFVINGDFVEGKEVRTHVPRTIFIHDHDHMRRVEDRTRVDNTYIKHFLNHFSQFHFFGKGDDDRDEYWEEGFLGQGEWNDNEHHRKEGVPGEWKKTT
jgi:hypothetical protein